jgi:FkbM family methyltransferase
VQWLILRIIRRLELPEPAAWQLRPKQLRHYVTVRLRASSDLPVFEEIFVDEVYSSLTDRGKALLVLDLGANVGFASAYFLSCFPNARVVAVEPDDRNAQACRSNLAPYGDRVLVLNGAVWSSTTRLCLARGVFGDGREWATQVREASGTESPEVQAWDIETLLGIAGGQMVDLIKIDIERGELAVFGNGPKAWLSRVRNLCIELHGEDCEVAFFEALADFDYTLERRGTLTICRTLHSRARA